MKTQNTLQNTNKKFAKDILQKVEPIKLGANIQGTLIVKEKTNLFVDLGIYGIGIVYGQEFYNAKDLIKGLKIGDQISAVVVDVENDDGYIELSMQQSGEEAFWDNLEKKMLNKEVVEVKIAQANKGGLMAQIGSKMAFLPVSQLSNEHYPRVDGGDKTQILNELKKFVGQTFKVRVFDLNSQEEKIIISEREAQSDEVEKVLGSYKVGDVVDCEVRGVADFGIFVKFLNTPENAPLVEGLVHISELDWQLIENPKDFYKVGDKIKAKIISVENGRISLSIKQLKSNPWDEVEKKYQKGQIVKGMVIKFNPFGAFIKLDKDIQALIHISEFGSEEKMKEKLELNKTYNFKILQMEPKEFKMALKLVESKVEKAENKSE